MLTAGPAMLILPLDLVSRFPAIMTAPGAAKRNPAKERIKVNARPAGNMRYSDQYPSFWAVILCPSSWNRKLITTSTTQARKSPR